MEKQILPQRVPEVGVQVKAIATGEVRSQESGASSENCKRASSFDNEAYPSLI